MPNVIYCRDGHYIGVAPERIHGGLPPRQARETTEVQFAGELRNSSHCKKCGKEATTECLHCQAPIEQDDLGGRRPAYCGACGRPFPWTESDRNYQNDGGEPETREPTEKWTMDSKERLKSLLASTTALQEAMRESLASVTGEHANLAKYASFKTYMQKYNRLVKAATRLLPDTALLDEFKLDSIKSSGEYRWPKQKELFDSVSANVAILRANLENAVGYAEDETQKLKYFIQANLRRAVSTAPQKETEVQNTIETLLIGRSMIKGIDYDRETGRVKTSGKESVPDFTFPNLNLCMEVKLSKSKNDLRKIVDEINADIRAYGTQYERQLYVVYDLSTIRDEDEFKKDIESVAGTSVTIVKH